VRAEQEVAPGSDVLFRVRADGGLAPATTAGAPEPRPGDAVVVLSPVPDSSPRSPSPAGPVGQV
jgi:hypothetical protein